MSLRLLAPALVLALGFTGAAQAAPAATTTQTVQPPAPNAKPSAAKPKQGFFCNMGPVTQGGPAPSGGRTLASGEDGEHESGGGHGGDDKDKGGGKKAPVGQTPATTATLQQQSQQQNAVTPQ